MGEGVGGGGGGGEQGKGAGAGGRGEGSEGGRTPGPRHFGRRRPRPKLYQHYITVCYRQLGNLVQFEKSPLPAPGGTVSGDLAGEPDRIPCFVRAIQALGGGERSFQ